MKVSCPVAFTAGAIMALVLGSGTAVAATGGKFILGKSNSATSTTVLTNTRGTALQLNSKAGTPALKVSNATKVPNLNADRLDGLDSAALALAAGQTNTVDGETFPIDFEPDGTFDVVVSVATCPSGTRLTGGGGDDLTSDGVLFSNSPLDKTTWFVGSTTTDMSATEDDVLAYAVCYNPRGSVPGGSFRVSATEAAETRANAIELLKERLAPKFD